MGAIPFLTVASMTDSVGVKVVMFLLSWGAGWSRINDDMHYASEVFMGWSLGFMGVDAVTRTKSGKNNFLFSPAILAGGTPGVQLAFNF
jgi:membrane-associated phospholipid phosphatase